MTRRHPDSLTSVALLSLNGREEMTAKEYLRCVKGAFDNQTRAESAAREMYATGLTERVVRLTDKGREALQIVKQLRGQK